RDFHVTGVQTCALPIYCMLQTAMALSLVVALDAPNTSAPPPMTQADPPPPSFAFDCQRESDCPVPGQCRSGRCVVSEAYVAGLRSAERRVGKGCRCRVL